MRNAGSGLLSLALMDARNHTLRLFSGLQRALDTMPSPVAMLPIVNPPIRELGHIGWFQEWWIARNMQRGLGRRCEPAHTRLASIEPNADRWWDPSNFPPDAGRSTGLPDAAHCKNYLLDTLEATLELLEKTGADAADDALYFYRLCLFHEDMHGEALVRTAQTLGLPLDPALQAAFVPQSLSPREALLIPATSWQLGSAGGPGFSFDNERPAHAVSVPEFEMDAQPVTWAQFVEFVDDGGYDREEIWQPAGWQWLQQLAAGEGRRGPRHVEEIGVASGAVMQTRFGRATRMAGNQPVQHVSWWEADAWCRWAGRRLPAEVEWEVAAHTAARRGFRWGEVWEWMGTTFRPYPGFSADPDVGYSEPCFGSHKVLRGASTVTRARLKNPKHRHFCPPERDDAFCGFRSCAL
jgi:gamma-glutamyl hercynylcysteine S-oxide synthase